MTKLCASCFLVTIKQNASPNPDEPEPREGAYPRAYSDRSFLTSPERRCLDLARPGSAFFGGGGLLRATISYLCPYTPCQFRTGFQAKGIKSNLPRPTKHPPVIPKRRPIVEPSGDLYRPPCSLASPLNNLPRLSNLRAARCHSTYNRPNLVRMDAPHSHKPKLTPRSRRIIERLV
jgi:hypothetical protein